jgi:starch-binding outer membrane protein, SusD/RagB family
LLIPKTLNSNSYSPFAYFTTSLIAAFDSGDQRRVSWIDSTIYRGVKYYFPYKYKLGPAQSIPNGSYSEYYMVLRLAEQYLIRAEAEAQLGDANAVTDLNTIRNRAGLTNYSGSADKDSLLNAIYHERQVELFVEWGHRWLDLKRIGQAITVLSASKGFEISSDALLYPIPPGDLQTDPNLTPNPGY